jgi:phage-related protein
MATKRISLNELRTLVKQNIENNTKNFEDFINESTDEDFLSLISNKDALRPVSQKDLDIIDKQIDKSRQENFRKFGKKIRMVACNLTNEYGTFKVFYFKEVYKYLKHLKSLDFLYEFDAICTVTDKLEHQISLAKKVKRKLIYNLEIIEDYFVRIN